MSATEFIYTEDAHPCANCEKDTHYYSFAGRVFLCSVECEYELNYDDYHFFMEHGATEDMEEFLLFESADPYAAAL